MCVLILIMTYISLIIGRRGFDGKDDLWDAPNLMVGSHLTLGASFKVECGP